jgi:hypothetical protein
VAVHGHGHVAVDGARADSSLWVGRISSVGADNAVAVRYQRATLCADGGEVLA